MTVFFTVFSKPQLVVLPHTICSFVHSHAIAPFNLPYYLSISLCHPSYLFPCSSSLPIPLPLKPEGLSRSTQITSLRLCICFQSHAINQASLGMFLSFSSSSIFLLPCPFLRFCLSCFSLASSLEDGHSLCVIQIKTDLNHIICLFPSMGGPRLSRTSIRFLPAG